MITCKMEREKKKSLNKKKGLFRHITQETKLDIQLLIAVVLVITGLALLLCGFWVVPIGEINNSVLVAFGECCTFAGSLMGIDYHYRFKTYKIDKQIDEENNEE